MLAAFLVLVAGQSAFHPGMPNIPTAMSPMQTAGIPHEEHTETANPWKFSSNMVDGTTDLLSRIKHAKHEGSDVNPEENAKLMAKMAGLADEVAAEADKISANERQQDANGDGIRQEGKDLVTVHHNQMGESSLYNLAANSANQIWKSEHNWQSALEQAGKVENFVAAADTDVIGVLGQGAQALDDAQTELTDLEKNAEAQVDELDQNCAQKLLDWSSESTTMLNDQTRTLKMVYERVDRMQKVFDKGHSLVVTLLQELSAQMKTVTGLSTVGTEGGESLLQTQEHTKMAQRIHAALQMPVKKVRHTNHTVDETGFWHKLHVLKDAFELHTGQALGPMEELVKKFEDA